MRFVVKGKSVDVRIVYFEYDQYKDDFPVFLLTVLQRAGKQICKRSSEMSWGRR